MTHNWHKFVIQVDKRDELKEWMSERGIETKIHYPFLLSDHPVFSATGEFENARRLSRTSLSLPIYPELTDKEITYVVDAIKSFCARGK